jgi:hypothetical protein
MGHANYGPLVKDKVLKNGNGRGRVAVFTVSAVTDAVTQIVVVAV